MTLGNWNGWGCCSGALLNQTTFEMSSPPYFSVLLLWQCPVNYISICQTDALALRYNESVLGCSASLQKSQRVSTLSLSSPSRHFRNIPAIHQTGWEIVNFMQILQEKMILSIVLERWKTDASMLRESFHCLCSIDTNACFAWQGVVSRVLWLEVMYSWQYSFLLTSPPYQYHMAKK